MKNSDLLKKYGIDIGTIYEVTITFDADFEVVDNIDRHILGTADHDKTDYALMPGSPASSPYITVKGPSKGAVEKLAAQILKHLLATEGVSIL